MVAPSLQTEGKALQRAQGIGMGRWRDAIPCTELSHGHRHAFRHRPGARRAGQGHPRRRREQRHDQEALRLDRVDSTEENRRDYREMLFSTPGVERLHQRRHLFDETIRQKAADGTTARRRSSRKGASSPASRSTPGRSRSPRARRDRHRGPRRSTRASRRVPLAGRPLRQVARRHTRSARRIPGDSASTRTPTRWPATRRSARRPASCRSSSPRSSWTATHSIDARYEVTTHAARRCSRRCAPAACSSRGRCSSPTWCCSG